MKRYTQTHDKHLNGNRVVTARGKSEQVNTAASVMTREMVVEAIRMVRACHTKRTKHKKTYQT